MSATPVSAMTPEQKDELICTYAALILHDDGSEVSTENLTSLIKAAGCSVEAYWPALYSKMVQGQDVSALLTAGDGGGGAAPAAGGAAAAGGDAGAAAGGKKEEKVEEVEEEDMEFDLFDWGEKWGDIT